MSSLTTRQLFHIKHNSQVQLCPSRSIPLSTLFITNKNNNSSTSEFSCHQNLSVVVKAAGGGGTISPKDQDYEDGVSLGTMKLPLDLRLYSFRAWSNGPAVENLLQKCEVEVRSAYTLPSKSPRCGTSLGNVPYMSVHWMVMASEYDLRIDPFD
ncbi:hypothetical protein K7X08_015579 [Anisodus acutangulus]|uniref:Uncharacterized protein n=1 Tax=Anisodus acutangulus TaxID=402998 RepID=A0A9Q1LEF0_9SOLA|nr:hypothetical protein K7X08_015579 [Anisodus acutangulus]